MKDPKLINKIAYYLMEDGISGLGDDLPEDPPFDSPDFDIWVQDNSRRYGKKLETFFKRRESIEKMISQGVYFVGLLRETKDYNEYITGRIHEFAKDWLDGQESYERRLENYQVTDEETYFNDSFEEKVLKDLNIETWEELKIIIRNFEFYCFKRGRL